MGLNPRFSGPQKAERAPQGGIKPGIYRDLIVRGVFSVHELLTFLEFLLCAQEENTCISLSSFSLVLAKVPWGKIPSRPQPSPSAAPSQPGGEFYSSLRFSFFVIHLCGAGLFPAGSTPVSYNRWFCTFTLTTAGPNWPQTFLWVQNPPVPRFHQLCQVLGGSGSLPPIRQAVEVRGNERQECLIAEKETSEKGGDSLCWMGEREEHSRERAGEEKCSWHGRFIEAERGCQGCAGAARGDAGTVPQVALAELVAQDCFPCSSALPPRPMLGEAVHVQPGC